MDLTQLEQLEVKTTVFRKEEDPFKVPAATYVLTQEDIRRSGATSIPEALRTAPGLQVEQIDANKWRISIRGFNSIFGDSLLVLIDGRSVYSPYLNGVYWDSQRVMLEDVERIDIVRGPGGSLWGANEVNGIINIVTKPSKDTQGSLLVGSYGSQDKALDEYRYGGTLGPNGSFRVYGMYQAVSDFEDSLGKPNNDAYDSRQGGFRSDWSQNKDKFTFQGDAYNEQLNQRSVNPTFTPPYSQTDLYSFPVSGHNLMGRWTRSWRGNDAASLQVYWDKTDRNTPEIHEIRDTYDADLQFQTTLGRHGLVYGIGYRSTSDWAGSNAILSTVPSQAVLPTTSGFFQDDYDVSQKLRLTAGAKAERDAYTGWNLEPTFRATYAKSDTQTYWTAITHTVEVPSVEDTGARFLYEVFQDPANGLPVALVTKGNPNLSNSTVDTAEVGARFIGPKGTSLDLTGYVNDYHGLRTLVSSGPTYVAGPMPYLLVSGTFTNGASGRTAGIEMASKFQPTNNWKLGLNYTLFSPKLSLETGSFDADGRLMSPRHQFSFTSDWSPAKAVDADVIANFMDANIGSRETSFSFSGPVLGEADPARWQVDLRLAWRPSNRAEYSLRAQNLFPTSEQYVFQLHETTGVPRRAFLLSGNWKF